MNQLLDGLIAIVQKNHIVDLDLKEDVYYIRLKDAMVCLYYNEDERSIKVDVEMIPKENTFVYFETKVNLEDLYFSKGETE